MTSSHDTLPFVVSIDYETVKGGEKGIFYRSEEPQLRDIPIASVKASMKAALEGLRELFDMVEELHEGLPLKEVQVAFEVTASGRVAILGTGVEGGGTGTLTLTFGR